MNTLHFPGGYFRSVFITPFLLALVISSNNAAVAQQVQQVGTPASDLAARHSPEADTSLAAMKNAFTTPPPEARPWVYWFWSNSNVTRKGITADLEAMHRMGIGGVLIMDVNQGTPESHIRFMDDQWQDMFRFAVQEAARLGMEINMNNDAGWNGSGGPWVEPEFAMQNLVYTETEVAGGRTVSIDLPQAPSSGGYYRDVAVVAIPVAETKQVGMSDVPYKLTAITDEGRRQSALPTENNQMKLSVRDKQKLPIIDIVFDKPYEACVLELDFGDLMGRADVEVQVSDDGRDFTTLRKSVVRDGKNSVVFNMATAGYYRIRFADINTYFPKDDISVSRFELHPRFKIDNLEMKLWNVYYEHGKKFNPVYLNAFQSAPLDQYAPSAAIVPKEKVIELTSNMEADGKLSWNAPGGKWKIFRYGHTWNGAVNTPAAIGGEGPECDKLSKEGIRRFFRDGLMKRLLDLTPEARKTFTTFHIDSWEINGQNWTKNMREEFRKRRGYDLVQYLPAFNDKVIGDLQETERFMWDMRQTISELMVENYVAEMQKICHENGMRFSMECYTTPASDLDAANFVDEPVAETWTSPGFHFTMKMMASAAHTNNRNIVSAEIFTSGWQEKWLMHPGSVKALGDSGFTGGINKFIFHRYAAQPWMNQFPGLSMGPWGLHYERTQTWWEYTLPWHTYLARCQYMLRQGRVVSDVLVLQPEEPGNWFEEISLKGYDYHAISPDAFHKVTVNNGVVTDGAGNPYRLIVLSHLGRMTEPLLRKLRDLVQQGAAVLGEPPVATPGLSNYPASDRQLKAIVAELWGERKEADRKVGKGRVLTGIAAEEALKRLGLIPDFTSTAAINYIHRKSGDNDIFFVANPKDSSLVTNCTFRVEGKIPQWWNPETGETTDIEIYAGESGYVRVPLALGPASSGFLIFSPGLSAEPPVKTILLGREVIVQDGMATPAVLEDFSRGGMLNYNSVEPLAEGVYTFIRQGGRKRTAAIHRPEAPFELSGSWTLRFPAGKGVPTELEIESLRSWTELDDREINYYSGAGTYLKSVNIPRGKIRKDARYYLDLGAVQAIAKAFVNGKEVGILWRPPFKIDITSAIRPGKNEFRIEVVNLWVNRQIGDEFLPEDTKRTGYERYKGQPYENGVLAEYPEWLLADGKSPTGRQTFTSWRLWNKTDTLQSSGLIGPVKIVQAKSVN